MARLFNDGDSEYLENANAILAAVPITMACWFNSNDDTANQTLVEIGTDGSNNNRFTLAARGGIVGDKIGANARGAGNAHAVTTAGFTAGTWHHACGVFATNSSRSAYIDGGAKGTEVTASTPAGMDVTPIGSQATNIVYMSGLIAEVAIWNVALTDAEVVILAAGFSPLFVRPQSLVAYWPLIRGINDRVGGYDLTAFSGDSGPVVAAHPPVIYPAPLSFFMAPVGAPPAGAMPMAMYDYRRRRV